MLGTLAQAIHHVSYSSQLILDPEINTYYLIETFTDTLPSLERRFDDYLTLSTAVVSAGRVSEAQRLRLVNLHGMIGADLAILVRDLMTALNNAGTPAASPETSVLHRHAVFLAAFTKHWQTLQIPVLRVHARTFDGVHLGSAQLASLQAFVAMDRAVGRSLDNALQERHQHLVLDLVLSTGLIAVMLLGRRHVPRQPAAQPAGDPAGERPPGH